MLSRKRNRNGEFVAQEQETPSQETEIQEIDWAQVNRDRIKRTMQYFEKTQNTKRSLADRISEIEFDDATTDLFSLQLGPTMAPSATPILNSYAPVKTQAVEKQQLQKALDAENLSSQAMTGYFAESLLDGELDQQLQNELRAKLAAQKIHVRKIPQLTIEEVNAISKAKRGSKEKANRRKKAKRRV